MNSKLFLLLKDGRPPLLCYPEWTEVRIRRVFITALVHVTPVHPDVTLNVWKVPSLC
jgi:hypothetical protein